MALLDRRLEGHLVDLGQSPGRYDLVHEVAGRFLVVGAVVLGIRHDAFGLDTLDVRHAHGGGEVRVLPVSLKGAPTLRDPVEVQFRALDHVDPLAPSLLAKDLAVTVRQGGVETGGNAERGR